ncbi:hypothetical protein CKA32_004431 [Geitlerinema sp. FC II]|nr:hypothetical protein CKA32_004431 [Geitlerinema sp. FC II]
MLRSRLENNSIIPLFDFFIRGASVTRRRSHRFKGVFYFFQQNTRQIGVILHLFLKARQKVKKM